MAAEGDAVAHRKERRHAIRADGWRVATPVESRLRRRGSTVDEIETAVGGESPALMVNGGLVLDTPLASVTLSVTWETPTLANVQVGVLRLRLSQVPPGIVHA